MLHVCMFTVYRFAQFFICPLFNADSKNREVNAVDSGNCRHQIKLHSLVILAHTTKRTNSVGVRNLSLNGYIVGARIPKLHSFVHTQ